MDPLIEEEEGAPTVVKVGPLRLSSSKISNESQGLSPSDLVRRHLAKTRLRPIGSTDYQERLFAGVSKPNFKTNKVCHIYEDCFQQTCIPVARNLQDARKRCSTEGRPNHSRVILNLLYGHQKRWRLQYSPEPATIEQEHSLPQVQDGDTLVNSRELISWGVAGKSRFKRRLLPCTDLAT